MPQEAIKYVDTFLFIFETWFYQQHRVTLNLPQLASSLLSSRSGLGLRYTSMPALCSHICM